MVEHFVLTNRDDRGGPGNKKVDRLSLINHSMLINAESLINMSKKRLCSQSSIETIQTMKLLRKEIGIVDPILEKYLVPECVYRNGICSELKPCGQLKQKLKEYCI